MDDTYSYLSNVYGKNHFELDKPFRVILEYYIGKSVDFSELGKFVGKELYEIADYIDKNANPKHIMWSVNGERVDSVWLDPAQRWVLEKLLKEYSVNKPPYKEGNWHKHYASLYLISDPGIACIITVTNQTAYALYKYGSEDLKKYVPHLIGDADPIMYGATWFTEIQGGSDLGANVTEAFYNGRTWVINGDAKYFASNVGLADMALVTARPKEAQPGAKGLALFLVPKINSSGKRNFIIRRLKEKSGTISVPTGEVEFHNSEAYLLGEQRKGIYYTMEDLMVSRLANSIGALGIARKSFLEAYYYTQVRNAFGKRLIEHPLVQRDLLDMEILIEGTTALAFKAVDQFQKSWMDTPPYTEKYHYARLLTHITKNITAETAAYVSKMAMEIYGGIGFLKEYPIERLHREALITPIWEGTSNIQALDMLEAIAKKGAHIQLLDDVKNLINDIREGKEIAEFAKTKIEETLSRLTTYSDTEAQFYAKDTLTSLGHSITVILLAHIGSKLNLDRFVTIAKLYSDRYLEGKSYSRDIVEKAKELFVIEELRSRRIVHHA
ncbi:MAG: acyl-CoA dehydrogenase family protein [Thermoprotei archaeon]